MQKASQGSARPDVHSDQSSCSALEHGVLRAPCGFLGRKFLLQVKLYVAFFFPVYGQAPWSAKDPTVSVPHSTAEREVLEF